MIVAEKEQEKFIRNQSPALYYAWKVGISGVMPSLVTGNGLIQSGGNSILFVKDNLAEVTTLRVGYSALCWVVGIAAYCGCVWMFVHGDVVPLNSPVHNNIYKIYFWAGVPIFFAVGVVVMFLRPIYVIALCDVYSDHLTARNETIILPENPGKAAHALVIFSILCLLIVTIMLFRDELGISSLLSTY